MFSSSQSDRPATHIRLAKPPRGIPLNFWSPDAISLLPREGQIFWGSSDLPVFAKTSGIYIHAASYECLIRRRMCTLTCWNFASTALGCNFFTIVVCESSFVYVTILYNCNKYNTIFASTILRCYIKNTYFNFDESYFFPSLKFHNYYFTHILYFYKAVSFGLLLFKKKLRWL